MSDTPAESVAAPRQREAWRFDRTGLVEGLILRARVCKCRSGKHVDDCELPKWRDALIVAIEEARSDATEADKVDAERWRSAEKTVAMIIGPPPNSAECNHNWVDYGDHWFCWSTCGETVNK